MRAGHGPNVHFFFLRVMPPGSLTGVCVRQASTLLTDDLGVAKPKEWGRNTAPGACVYVFILDG